ncbi:hypothetical protein E2C01_092525 [Portunus trituberculatus]|uniref:Uncharacterized protein n=1 Tax=Portunus trituberculatus TaxID=210409 RepID=A0A5B7JM69_PORTR|nr:hypothetical protein [Portunus trituberculatus]
MTTQHSRGHSQNRLGEAHPAPDEDLCLCDPDVSHKVDHSQSRHQHCTLKAIEALTIDTRRLTNDCIRLEVTGNSLGIDVTESTYHRKGYRKTRTLLRKKRKV